MILDRVSGLDLAGFQVFVRMVTIGVYFDQKMVGNGVNLIFTRSIDKDLREWSANPRRKPLILRGARQVGKSTAVRSLASAEGFDLVEINLERHSYLNKVFASFDLAKICLELDSIAGRSIRSLKKPLLFLDEIQATPAALAALRYFFEDAPELPVLAAGSLLEFALADFQYSMPVGRVEYRFLSPLSFEEYLAAAGENFLLQVLQNTKQDFAALSDHSHEKLLSKHRQFLYVGGMPEAVSHFLSRQDPVACEAVQQALLDTFEDDLAKYSSGNALARLRDVYRKLPHHVGLKIKYANFSKEEKAGEIKQSLMQLAMAQLWYPVHHSDCVGRPLGATKSEEVHKALFLDVGLMNRAMQVRWSHVAKLDERTLCNEGVIAEQYIGQELLYRRGAREKPSLYYWLGEKKAGNAEVDYVIDDHEAIIPIEVKSGKSGTLRSILQFTSAHKSPLAVRFDLQKPSLQTTEYPLLSLPLYMSGDCVKIIDRVLEGQRKG